MYRVTRHNVASGVLWFQVSFITLGEMSSEISDQLHLHFTFRQRFFGILLKMLIAFLIESQMRTVTPL